jgi:hypothetical protein
MGKMFGDYIVSAERRIYVLLGILGVGFESLF